MNIRYKREMNHNYLIISESDDMYMENYQLNMMAENHIEGLLRLYVRSVDEKKEFYYEISSKQPLNRILEGRKISREEISTLLISISTILTRMENYLLEEKQILLEPEYIYIEPSNFCIHLCCIPGFIGNFPEAIRRLLQYLLDKVDYQNRENIALVYHLYQESLKENYKMEDLLCLLTRPEKDQSQLTYNINEKEILDEPKEEFSYEVDKEKGNRGLNQLTLWFRELFVGKKSEKQLIYSYVREDDEVYQLKSSFENVDLVGATILLSDIEEESEKAIMLKSADPSSYEDIFIDRTPFIIGKNKKGVNYTLSAPAVSRFHVRVDNYNGGYLLTDLNSTNGTMVNGHLLDANETIELLHGDKIAIASIEYCFYSAKQ